MSKTGENKIPFIQVFYDPKLCNWDSAIAKAVKKLGLEGRPRTIFADPSTDSSKLKKFDPVNHE